MGYKLGANQLEDAFVRMKALADRKKDIYDEDIEALVDQESRPRMTGSSWSR